MDLLTLQDKVNINNGFSSYDPNVGELVELKQQPTFDSANVEVLSTDDALDGSPDPDNSPNV